MAGYELAVLMRRDRKRDTRRVAEALRGRGLRVTDAIPRFGLVLVACDEALTDEIRSIDGVRSVRRLPVFGNPEAT
jgi:hypothetical protein